MKTSLMNYKISSESNIINVHSMKKEARQLPYTFTPRIRKLTLNSALAEKSIHAADLAILSTYVFW